MLKNIKDYFFSALPSWPFTVRFSLYQCICCLQRKTTLWLYSLSFNPCLDMTLWYHKYITSNYLKSCRYLLSKVPAHGKVKQILLSSTPPFPSLPLKKKQLLQTYTLLKGEGKKPTASHRKLKHLLLQQ